MARHRSDGNLLLVFGQEGAGKSTVLRSLLRKTPSAAQVDAEDPGQVHPWVMDAAFLDLLWNNVIDVIRNFWRAGYQNVLAGGHLVDYEDYSRFRQRLEGIGSEPIIELSQRTVPESVSRWRPKWSKRPVKALYAWAPSPMWIW